MWNPKKLWSASAVSAAALLGMYLAGAVCGCAAILVTYLSTTGAILLGGLVMISMLPAVAWLERAPYERQFNKTAA